MSRLARLIIAPFADGTVRRFLFVAVVAFWLGGFTFYGGVVIPAGIRVLGGHVKQGFVTQQVTDGLNLAGAVALPIMLWNALAIRRGQGRLARFLSLATWVVMAAVQVELFLLHPALDRLLDPRARAVLDEDHFDWLHRMYLASATLQWCAGVLHVWLWVAASTTATQNSGKVKNPFASRPE